MMLMQLAQVNPHGKTKSLKKKKKGKIIQRTKPSDNKPKALRNEVTGAVRIQPVRVCGPAGLLL